MFSRQVCKIGNHVNEDVDALEEDGLVDELVVVVEEDRGAVEGGEADGRHPNLRVDSVHYGEVIMGRWKWQFCIFKGIFSLSWSFPKIHKVKI